MTGVAQALPVRARPECVLIALVRGDVIKISSCCDPALALTLSAQRMLGKEPLASLLPLVAIPSLRTALSPLVMLSSDYPGQVFMLGAVPHSSD